MPLIVLTADRPPELREVGAGQTIDQVKLYGDAVKWFFEVGVQTPPTTACAGSARWPAARTGPRSTGAGPGSPQLPAARAARARRSRCPTTTAAGPTAGLDAPLPVTPPPAGALTPRSRPRRRRRRPRARARLGAAAAGSPAPGYPLLADPLSGARRGPAAIAHYDLLLRDAGSPPSQPELVIRVGDLPTSKPLRTWLAWLQDARAGRVDPEGAWQDPAAVVSRPGPEIGALRSRRTRLRRRPMPSGRRLAPRRRRRRRRDRARSATSCPSRSWPASLGEWLPPEATLFVASSMPIRDVEMFLAARGGRPACSRTAAPTGSTAPSRRRSAPPPSSDGPVVLLIGDVALAHDIGGLLAATRLGLVADDRAAQQRRRRDRARLRPRVRARRDGGQAPGDAAAAGGLERGALARRARARPPRRSGGAERGSAHGRCAPRRSWCGDG